MVFILRQLFNKSHFTKRISFIFSLNFIFQSWLFLKLNSTHRPKIEIINPILQVRTDTFRSKILLTFQNHCWPFIYYNEKSKINKTVVKKQTQDSNFSSNNCQQDCNEQDCNTCTRLVPCTVKKSNPLSILTTANNNNNNNNN